MRPLPSRPPAAGVERKLGGYLDESILLGLGMTTQTARIAPIAGDHVLLGRLPRETMVTIPYNKGATS